MEPLQALPPGTIVYGADGEMIGTVQSADDLYVVVDTDDWPPNLYIPVDAIVETSEDGAFLSVTGDDARDQGWGREPEVEELPEAAAETGIGYSAVQTEDSLDEDRGAMAGREESPVTPRRPACTEDAIDPASGDTGPGISGPR